MSARTPRVIIGQMGSVITAEVDVPEVASNFAQKAALYTLAAQVFGYAESEGREWAVVVEPDRNQIKVQAIRPPFPTMRERAIALIARAAGALQYSLIIEPDPGLSPKAPR
jgi:hypothetical protein